MKGQVSVFFLILLFLVFSAALGAAIGAGRFLHGADKAPATYSGLTVQGLLHHAGSKDGLLVSVLEHCETDDAPRHVRAAAFGAEQRGPPGLIGDAVPDGRTRQLVGGA